MRRLLAALLITVLLMASMPAADAATTRSLTISTSSTGSSSPFKQFDTALEAYDFNGDGRKEIIGHNNNRHVYVFDSGNGRILADLRTTHPSGWGANTLNAPEVAVLSHGGAPHVVVANSAAYITLFRYDGSSGGEHHFTKVWERRTTGCGGVPSMDAKPVLGDVDQDGRFEIVATTEDTGLFVLNHDGSTLWKKCPGQGVGGGNGDPGIADLNRDGFPDVVYVGDDGLVAAFSGPTGAWLWAYNVRDNFNLRSGSIPVGPGIGQLDGRGGPDIVVGARDSHDTQNHDNDHALLIALSSGGSVLWAKQHPRANPLTYTHPVVVDADNNGVNEVYWGDWNTIGHKGGIPPGDSWQTTGPANFYRYSNTGQLVWRTELNTYWSNKDLALADVDGDGIQEVLANGPGDGGDGIWYLDSRNGNKERFVSTHPWKVTRGPTVWDLRGDGGMQWIVPVEAADNSVSGGAIQVYETGVGYNAIYPHVPDARLGSGGGGGGGGGGAFSATFDVPDTTNNWWVEVYVKSGATVTGVTAEVNGAQHTLQKKSWGSWAASFHVQDGSKVVFHARDGQGRTASSGTYTWGDASAPPPSGFDARFTVHDTTNNWWVEVYVDGNEPISKVTASVDGGAAMTLEKKSWGSWAKSFHVPDGSQVVFTATGSSGATDKSKSFTWGSGGGSGPGSDFTASFQSKHTDNNWWVETAVDANRPVQAVQARVDGGSWRTLDKTDWGSWAKSFHVPDGSRVEFRASDGSTWIRSDPVTWG